MRLYIAEKPSMGREIAKCLPGPVERRDGYLVTQGGVVTWLFGHILRQAEPEEYSASYKRWRAEDLPIIPDKWQLYVAKDCEKQFAIVKGLIEKADDCDPYRRAITWRDFDRQANRFAAWPEEVSIAPTPPSRSAILAAAWSLVGFWRRV